MTAVTPITQQHGEDATGPISPVISATTGGDKEDISAHGGNAATSANVNPVTPGHTSRNSSRSGSSSGVEHESLKDDNGLLLPARFSFPRCRQDFLKSENEAIEEFVEKAISSQHENGGPSDSCEVGKAEANIAAEALKAYRAIADSLRRPEDPAMLRKLFVALRTAGKGSSLYRIACFADRHAQLMHLVCKFNAFDLPRTLEGASDETKLPYHDHSLADAYMHLVVAIISANSVHVVPFMSAIWRTLTFGRTGIQDST